MKLFGSPPTDNFSPIPSPDNEKSGSFKSRFFHHYMNNQKKEHKSSKLMEIVKFFKKVKKK